MGIEPTYSAWKAEVLPLNYTRRFRGPLNSPFITHPIETVSKKQRQKTLDQNHSVVKSDDKGIKSGGGGRI